MAIPGFGIQEYITQKGFQGGQRAYLFLYEPDIPIVNAEKGMNKYLVRTTNLPETTMEEIMVNWQGQDFKFAGKYTFSDFTVTFNVDLNAQIRDLFEQWMNLTHDIRSNVHAPLDQYMQDQLISLLDYDGNKLKTFRLVKAWPKMVGPVSLDYGTNDVSQFDITLSYQYHYIEE